MKKLIYIIPLCLLYIQCYAQTNLVQGEIKTNGNTIIVHKLKQFDSVKYISVYTKNNKYINGIPWPKKQLMPILRKDMQVNTEDIKPIVYKVLSGKLNSLKRNNEVINVNFIFKPSGEVTDIGFSLHENTLITVQEIDQIDKQLRSKIKATFTGKDYLEYEAIGSKNIPPITFDIN